MERSELEIALTRLSHDIAFPPTPALVTAVRSGIAVRAPHARRAWWPRAASVLAVGIALFAAVMVFSPAARHAVADFLGLEGARVTVEPSPLPTDLPVLGEDLNLGRPVSMAEAEEIAEFEVLIPSALGTPDEIYTSAHEPRLISLVYSPRQGIPESGATGVGALISQFEGRLARGDFLDKTVFSGGRVIPVKVDGRPGLWIEGAHEVFFRDESGVVLGDTVRLAGSTLLWESGDLTLRLEANVTKAEALRIARSMR